MWLRTALFVGHKNYKEEKVGAKRNKLNEEVGLRNRLAEMHKLGRYITREHGVRTHKRCEALEELGFTLNEEYGGYNNNFSNVHMVEILKDTDQEFNERLIKIRLTIQATVGSKQEKYKTLLIGEWKNNEED